MLQRDTIVWFWVGNHEEYDRLLASWGGMTTQDGCLGSPNFDPLFTDRTSTRLTTARSEEALLRESPLQQPTLDLRALCS